LTEHSRADWFGRPTLPACLVFAATTALLVSFALPWVSLDAKVCVLGTCWPESPVHASPILMLIASVGVSSVTTNATELESIAVGVLDLVMLSAAPLAFLGAAYRVLRGQNAPEASWISVAALATVAVTWLTFPVLVLSTSGSSYGPGVIVGLVCTWVGLVAAAADLALSDRRHKRQSRLEGLAAQLPEAGHA
jgi:hypothetical protein